MIKRTVTFKNPFTDEMVSRELYFNVNLAEAMHLEMYDDLSNQLKHIGSLSMEGDDLHKNKKETYTFFEWLIGKSYGVRSEDGENFEKSKENMEKFMTSEAYSAMLEWLLFDDNASDNAANFISGLFPDSLMENAKKLAEAEKKKNK